jgi:YVTN family beta-propeller protein
MKINKLLLIAVGATLFFSCSQDDEITSVPFPGAYENGFFVLNEGTSFGSVSYVSNDLNTIQQDIYAAVNPADNLGKILQSIFFDGDKAYVISNDSNKITIVNRKTFKVIGKIDTGLQLPRYGVVENGKAYVTNAKTFSYVNPTTGDTDDFVAVINLTTNLVETKIPLDTFGEKIFAKNGKIYVLNSGFGVGKTMQVINPVTNAITKTLTFGNSPNSMFEKNGSLYVLCSDNPFGGTPGLSELAKVNLTTDVIDDTKIFDEILKKAQNLTSYNDKFYFTVDNKVYDDELTTATISSTSLFTSDASYLYGFNINKGKIYVSDAGSFTTNGDAYIYNLEGLKLKKIDTGIAPNGFYFN